MKAKFFLLVTLAMIVLSGCESNMPEWNDNGRNKLVGTWRVVKETVTNGDGFGGVVTRTEVLHWGIDSYHFYETYVVIWNSHASYIADLPHYPYSLTEQKDGTWLMTIPEMFDQPRNLDGGLSPITIHRLTNEKMEWQFEAYGGDEGPVVYYQYLKKITENAQ